MNEVLEWLSQSEYDLDTAQAMLDSGRYIYAVFMCHLAVEKALKALVVKRTENAPPRTHNLKFSWSDWRVPSWRMRRSSSSPVWGLPVSLLDTPRN